MEQDKDDEQAGQHSLQRLLLQGEDEASQWQLNVIMFGKSTFRLFCRFRYVAILDVDEVILPKRHKNLVEMMEYLVKTHEIP